MTLIPRLTKQQLIKLFWSLQSFSTMELLGANLLPLGAGLYLVHLRKRMDFGELRNGCVPDVLCYISYLTSPWAAHSKSKMQHNMHIFAGFLNCTQQILATPYFCAREQKNRKRERREWGGRERGSESSFARLYIQPKQIHTQSSKLLVSRLDREIWLD